LKRPGREISPVHSVRAPLGHSAQQLTARPPNRPGAASLLGQIWPSHRLVAPSPSDLNPTAARARRANKTGDGALHRNPSGISPSPFSLHATQRRPERHGGRAEQAGRRHRGLLAGARARRRVRAPPLSRPWTEPCSRAPRARPRRPEATSGGASCAAPRRSRLRGSVPHEGGRLWGGPGEYPPPFALGLGFAVRFDSKSTFSFDLLSIRGEILLSPSRSTL